MSNRVSNVILLCEDDEHARLLRAFLRICGHVANIRSRVASREKHGGNVGWVLDHYAEELRACRQRNARAKTLLVVMVDADDSAVDERHRELAKRAEAAGLGKLQKDEPVVVLVAKRHVETWIRVACGDSVSEEEDCTFNRPPTQQQFRNAAQAIYDRSRPNAARQQPTVPSLDEALPHWRRISESICG